MVSIARLAIRESDAIPCRDGDRTGLQSRACASRGYFGAKTKMLRDRSDRGGGKSHTEKVQLSLEAHRREIFGGQLRRAARRRHMTTRDSDGANH